MNFASAYRELVMPDLRRMCRLQAVFIAHGRHSFTHGTSVVWRIATARGAAHLPNAIVDQLDDWIVTTILTVIAEIDASPDVAPAIVDEYLEAVCPAMT